MPSPGPGGSQSSLAGMVSWLTSQFRARPKQQPKKGAISRAAAEIEPVSRMLSSSAALPGPMRAPDSKTMLILTRGMPALCHVRRFAW